MFSYSKCYGSNFRTSQFFLVRKYYGIFVICEPAVNKKYVGKTFVKIMYNFVTLRAVYKIDKNKSFTKKCSFAVH